MVSATTMLVMRKMLMAGSGQHPLGWPVDQLVLLMAVTDRPACCGGLLAAEACRDDP
jgi:hypothetical protein